MTRRSTKPLDHPRSLLGTGGLDRRRLLRTGSAIGGGLALRGAVPASAASGRSLPQGDRLNKSSSALKYQIEGRLLEVCTCGVLCPCWVGQDPDGGTCDAATAYGVDAGTIEGIDVSGRVLAMAVHIPGNILAGEWKAVVYVDDGATDEQHDALVRLFTGELGGPLADIASLIGEVLAVERVPIIFTVDEGLGTLTIGTTVQAELAPLQGATGGLTTLSDTVFSTIPGSPAFVGKADHFRRSGDLHGLASLDIQGHNAIQGYFHFEG
jgi:hypothetical protein